MKVKDLIEYLVELEPDMEVRIGGQEDCPYQYDIDGVVDGLNLYELDECKNESSKGVVYLLQGYQLEELAKYAWDLI